jgi:hypothetical protein
LPLVDRKQLRVSLCHQLFPQQCPWTFHCCLATLIYPIWQLASIISYEVCARNAGNYGNRTSHEDSKEEDIDEEKDLGIWRYHD